MEAILELGGWRTWVVVGPLAAMLAAAAVTDFDSRTIPNRLTYPGFGVGLLAHALALGWSGLGWGFLTAFVVLVVGYILLVFGLMGGGDVKLLTASGAFLGFQGLGEMLFYAMLVGFFMGIGQAIWNGALGAMLRRLGRFLMGLIRSAAYQTTQVAEGIETDESTEVPFAVAIFLGGVLAYSDAAYGWPGLIEFLLQQGVAP